MLVFRFAVRHFDTFLINIPCRPFTLPGASYGTFLEARFEALEALLEASLGCLDLSWGSLEALSVLLRLSGLSWGSYTHGSV